MTTGRSADHKRVSGIIRRGHRGRCGVRGATLLELIFVMVIICSVLAMAAPSLRGFFGSRKTSNAASQMLALMKKARSQAVAEGRVYRFNLDTDEGTYWLTARRGGVFEHLYCEFGRIFTLPDGTVACWLDESRKDAYDCIEFYPDATTEPTAMRLIGRQGEVVDLECPSATEFFRMRSPYEDGEL